MNAENEKKVTPLHYAAQYGKFCLIYFAIKTEHSFGLYWILFYNANVIIYLLGNEKVAELLVRNGANVNALDETNSTPLHNAAYYSKFYLILYECYWVLKTIRVHLSISPLNFLWISFHLDHLNISKILFDNGAFVTQNLDARTSFDMDNFTDTAGNISMT